MKKHILNCLLLAFLVFGQAACNRGENKAAETQTGTETTDTSSETKAAEPAPEVVEGKELNKYFPASEGEFEIIFTQEKDGFVQAKLKKNGEDAATFGLSDFAENADAAAKYAGVSDQLAGFPTVAVGSKGTAVLVGGRYQIQVRSLADSFDESMRKAWIEKFDLSALAKR